MRGFLVALFMAALSAAHAQDGSGVTEKPPSQKENETGKKETGEGNSSKSALPVKNIEEPDEANRTRHREDTSDKREAEDLIAQQWAAYAAVQSAASSKRQEYLARWQLAAAALGIVALIITLRIARRANAIAFQAVADAREMGEAQMRAYVHVEKCGIDKIAGGHEFVFFVSNKGQTPAKNVLIGAVAEVVDIASQGRIEIPADLEWKPLGSYACNETLDVQLDPKEIGDRPIKIAAIFADAFISVKGTVRHDDVFGAIFETDFAFKIPGLPRKSTLLNRPVAALRAYEKVGQKKAKTPKRWFRRASHGQASESAP